MPDSPREPSPPLPPKGVPRWLWPPPSATVERASIRERFDAEGVATYAMSEGETPALSHVQSLEWLIDEYTFSERPTDGEPAEAVIRLEIARSEMAGARVGHTYALDGGPLGAPSADDARGVLRRYIAHRLERTSND